MLETVLYKIDELKNIFEAKKIQFTFNETTSKWEFNYLSTATGQVIGTQVSYRKTIETKNLLVKKTMSLQGNCTIQNDIEK